MAEDDRQTIDFVYCGKQFKTLKGLRPSNLVPRADALVYVGLDQQFRIVSCPHCHLCFGVEMEPKTE
jgi:hypothetical protein